MQKKLISLFILGYLFNFTAIAMKPENSPSVKKTLTQALPSEVWYTIAHYLDVSSSFFNELSRQVNLAPADYKRMVEAFLASLDKYPEIKEIDQLINKHFNFGYSETRTYIKDLMENYISGRPVWQWSILEKSVVHFKNYLESRNTAKFNLSFEHLYNIRVELGLCEDDFINYFAKTISRLPIENQLYMQRFINTFLAELKKTHLMLSKFIRDNTKFVNLIGKNSSVLTRLAKVEEAIPVFAPIGISILLSTIFIYKKFGNKIFIYPRLIAKFINFFMSATMAGGSFIAFTYLFYDQFENLAIRYLTYLDSKYPRLIARQLVERYESNLGCFERMQEICDRHIIFYSKLKLALSTSNQPKRNQIK